jgi:hypothetical protein
VRYAKEGLESDTRRIIEYIKKIGIASVLTGQEMLVTNAILLFSPVAKEACRQGMENALVSIALALGKSEKRQQGRNGSSSKNCSFMSGRNGNTITFTKTRKQIIAVIFALGEIGKSVTKQSLGDVATVQ